MQKALSDKQSSQTVVYQLWTNYLDLNLNPVFSIADRFKPASLGAEFERDLFVGFFGIP